MHHLRLLLLSMVLFIQEGVRAAFVPDTLPLSAPRSDKAYQPAIDFDTNACYNVAVIGPDGRRAEGLPTKGVWPPQLYCREDWMLNHQNVYSRQRCNSDMCVYLYAYYFQKDTSGTSRVDAAGHTHDWEHIAVWARISTGAIEAVSVSQHGDYLIRPAKEVVFDDLGKPMVVYQKDGVGTHNFRFATNGDNPPENHWGAWIRAPLVGYFGWPSVELRDTMYTWDYGDANMGLTNERFHSEIWASKPAWIKFDPNYDLPDTNKFFWGWE